MSETHRQILRATSIIGGSSLVNVAVGLLRNKVAALILGPAGIGLVGLFHNLMQTGAALAAFGIGNVGTRQLAEAADDAQAQAVARRALASAAIALALIGGLLMFLARRPIAELVLGRADWAVNVGWLAVGLALLVGTVAQNGLLTGLRRLGDLARVSVASGIVGTVAGIAVLLVWREQGLLAFVLVSPLATFAVGAYFVRRLPAARVPRPRLGELVPQWRTLARLGLAFTVGSLVGTAGQLAVRSLVGRQLGAESLGQFQAAWTISMNYIGFILTTMAADYYPRLTAAMRDPAEAVRTVNHQAEVALLLAGPVLVGTVAVAPWIVQLLYSPEFVPAAALLRWQIVGDLIKIASWPLGFTLLAAGRGRAFMLTEALGAAVLVGVTAVLLPRAGLLAPGMAYVATYLVYLAVVFALARRLIGYTPSVAAVQAMLAVGLALLGTLAVTAVDPATGSAVGLAAAAALAWFAAVRLHHALPRPVAALLAFLPGVGRLRP
jgi:PST family polysaccharide transporter